MPTLSVIIPAYNEARRLGRTLERIRDYTTGVGIACELVVVDDGSRDATTDVARRFNPGPLAIRLLRNDANRGKGYSVRRGMLAATGELLLLCDADLSAPIEEIERLLPWIERGCDVAIASRDLAESRLDPPQPRLRRWSAWAFRAVRRRLLLPQIRDTQCGFKLFRRLAGRAIFKRQTVTGWLFDCEVLALAERLGYQIKEVGIHWQDYPDTRVRPLRQALSAMPLLLSIRRRVRAVRART